MLLNLIDSIRFFEHFYRKNDKNSFFIGFLIKKCCLGSVNFGKKITVKPFSDNFIGSEHNTLSLKEIY